MSCAQDNIQRLLEAQINTYYLESVATAVTAANVTEVTCAGDTDAFCTFLPNYDASISSLQVQLTGVSDPNLATIDLHLAYALASVVGEVHTAAIAAPVTMISTTVGSATAVIDLPWHRFGVNQGLSPGNAIMRVRPASGTATCTARVVFITKAPWPVYRLD